MPAHPTDRCVIVFGRYPQPGKVKTRLIPSLGPLGAADLQRWLTERTLDTVVTAEFGEVGFHFDGASSRHVRRWLEQRRIRIATQCDGDLGQRMDGSIRTALEAGHRKVVLVGTDLPDMTAGHIRAAFDALANNDLVLGPSTDGGYWLVGAKGPLPIFQGIPWGSDQVLNRTLDSAKAHGLKTALVEPLNDIDTPKDLEAWPPHTDWQRPFLSVILPTLNEALCIDDTIRQIQRPHTQVLVADGGSRDKTVELARATGATVITSPAGRAIQQNSAAQQASGRVLLFLHADTRLPVDYDTQTFETLMDPGVVMGAFRFKTDLDHPGMRLIEKTANLRAAWFHLPYGDQGFFIRKDMFNKAGGFPQVPIAEDLFLARRLGRMGRIRLARGHAITSARRWQTLGLFRTTLINSLIAGGCLLGVSPFRLASLYKLGLTPTLHKKA